MEIVLGWVLFSIVAGMIAGSKGRSGFGYFFLSLILSPLIGLLLAIALPALNPPATAAGPAAPPSDSYIKCPDCRELVLKDARKCKHCGSTLVPVAEMTQEQLLAHYEIRLVAGRYEFNGHSYAQAEDALRYAQNTQA
jgi:hypothetical protein